MVTDSFFGDGNFSKTFSFLATQLHIINDGTVALTVTVGNSSFAVLPNEEFGIEDLSIFTSISIVAFGNWRCVVQGQQTYSIVKTTITILLPEIRTRIRDEGKIEIGDDDVFIPYVNEAITWLNNQLISLQDPIMIMESEIMDNSVIPIGFVKFAGQHPVAMTGNTLKIINGSNSVFARYWANKPLVTSCLDAIDFPDQYNGVLAQYTAISVINKMGKSIEQDSAMFKQLADSFTQARGRG